MNHELSVRFLLAGLVWLAGLSISQSQTLPRPLLGEDYTIPGMEMEMVWIEPGSFWMGSPEIEPGRKIDEIRHQVTLTQGYWMGKYEVPTAQWERIMGSQTAKSKKQKADSPIEEVSWSDVQVFLEKLNERELKAKRLPEGYRYLLPTEAQWEYACRAGTDSAYSFGDSADDLGDYAWHYDNSATGFLFGKKRHLHPVGKKSPNPWGLHDMHGNVYEWCHDWYVGYTSDPTIDPAGPDNGAFRVFRGGSWYVGPEDCRSAIRRRHSPTYQVHSIGFRLSLRVSE
jgi:formylglycine-generating enzyme required for sulfatase activity